jgi:hypothetical protein
MKAGSTHTLRAVMDGVELKVFADGAPVWEGNVGAEAARLHGPVGIRSYNARLTLTLGAKRSRPGEKENLPPCSHDAGE